MTVPVTIGPATLYHGDCLDILPAMAGAERADLLATDAPYRLTSGGNNPSPGFNGMSGKFAIGRYDNCGEIVKCGVEWEDWLPAAYAALADDADAYVMANDKHVGRAQAAALAAGFGFHNLLSWDKGRPTPNRWYMKHLEFTLYLWKGRARPINDKGAQQQLRGRLVPESDHPTEKPVALMAEYIRQSTVPGGLVLDPFMGSGTTGVAAVRAGRRFVGIELSRRWYDVAVALISAALDSPSLFAPAGPQGGG